MQHAGRWPLRDLGSDRAGRYENVDHIENDTNDKDDKELYELIV